MVGIIGVGVEGAGNQVRYQCRWQPVGPASLEEFLRQGLTNQLFKGKSIYEAQVPQRPSVNDHGRGFLAPGVRKPEGRVGQTSGRSRVSLTVVQDMSPGCSQLALSPPCCCPPFTQDLPYCIPPH